MNDPLVEKPLSDFPLTDERGMPVMKVNLKFNRIYFNVCAVRSLQLNECHFQILLRGTRWVLAKSDSSVDSLPLTFYNNAYYVVCKKLVYQLVNHFEQDHLSFLIVGTEQKRKYHTLKLFVPDRKASRQPKEDPQLASAANIIARFQQTNFPGRVKTKEVIRAEQIVNNRAKI